MNWAPLLKVAGDAIKSIISSNNNKTVISVLPKEEKSMMPVTIERICKILDKEEAVYNIVPSETKNKLPRIVLKFEKDDTLKRDVYIVFAIQDNMFMLGGVTDFFIENDKIPDVILFCNLWNSKNYIPTVSVSEDGKLSADCCFFIDIDVSDDYIRENMIIVFLSHTYKFYCDFLNNFA
ncbi:MAG: hypothetical protein K5751_00910 [Treponemataceae bacterium]|nr:hypothetical protein [Treponemataceae bacterium]